MIQVKICGITNVQDALVAADAGADMLGFVFFEQSPRFVKPEHVDEIVGVVRASGHAAKCVGVFVDDSLERVSEIMRIAHLDLAQLHGDEAVEMVSALGQHVVKALRPVSAEDARAAIERYRRAVGSNTPAFLVDAYDARRFGGAGAQADWAIASQCAREFPILLAGGLKAENVIEAIQAVKPWGVDLSSGVEEAPGKKDDAKVRAFIRKAKGER